MQDTLHTLGQVPSGLLNAYATVEAARRGITPGMLALQRQRAEAELAGGQRAGAIQKAAAIQDPAARAFLEAHPDMAAAFGLPTSGGEAGPGTVLPPQIDTMPMIQRESALLDLPFKQARNRMWGLSTGEAGPPLTPVGGGAPGLVGSPGGAPFNPLTSPASPNVGVGGLTITGFSSTGFPIFGYGDVRGMPAGTTDPETGKPIQSGRRIGKTTILTTPQPGQLATAQGGENFLDVVHTAQRMMESKDFAEARSRLGGPLHSSGLARLGLPNEIGTQYKGGGDPVIPRLPLIGQIGHGPLTDNESLLAGVLGNLRAVAVQALAGTGAGRLKQVIEEFYNHVPDLDKDNERTINDKLKILDSRYQKQLARIPATGSIPTDMDWEGIFGDLITGSPTSAAPSTVPSGPPPTTAPRSLKSVGGVLTIDQYRQKYLPR